MLGQGFGKVLGGKNRTGLQCAPASPVTSYNFALLLFILLSDIGLYTLTSIVAEASTRKFYSQQKKR